MERCQISKHFRFIWPLFFMPGSNCSILGCNTSRKSTGISIFAVPKGEDDLSKKTREEWVKQITRNRVLDQDLKRQINARTLHICEKHFEERFIEKHSTRKKLITGAIPTLNLLKKSFESETQSRKIVQRHETPIKSTRARLYKHLDDFKNIVARVKLSEWSRKETEHDFTLDYYDAKHALPLYSIRVDSGLGFSIAAFGWFLPDTHEIYYQHKRSLFHISASTLCKAVQSFSICPGLPETIAATDPVVGISEVTKHSVPIAPELYCDDGPQFKVEVFIRSENCDVLCDLAEQDSCNSCLCVFEAGKKRERIVSRQKSEAVKDKAPLASCSKERLIATIQKQRVRCKDLENELVQMQKDIHSNSIEVNKTLEEDILSIISSSDMKSTPHMNLFWQQQKKLLASPNFGRRYHPHLIRFCLSIHSKSPSAYRELASSGVLVLPSERVLRDYRNFFKPKPGFNEANVAQLREQTNQLFDVQRYVVLSFDEMKIQSNLVFEKHSNELIGFVDLGDDDVNLAALDSPTAVASHVLAFMVRGVASHLKYILGYFSTENVTAYQLMPLFWKAVSILELGCNLWVCAAVSDGASPNRKFYELHAGLVGEEYKVDFVHRTVNLFAPKRFIYFFSDAPHLLKTARNCLFNSGIYSKHTRLMWNGENMMWNHIAALYHADLEQDLHQLPKLTVDHINLTSFSKMKVRLAAQVLSHTVAMALLRHYPNKEAEETAKFCEMVNRFFDCLNTRSTTEHTRKRNEFLAPYTSVDDKRFDWLQNVFLSYLEDWYKAVEERPGEFSADDRAKMFISQQTYKGMNITVNSLIKVAKFLISEGCEFVLSEKLCQDPLEEYFGHQRARGRYSDNPTVQSFGYNDLTLAVQRGIAPVVRGNVSGRHEGKRSKWFAVSEEPLPKRKRKKQ